MDTFRGLQRSTEASLQSIGRYWTEIEHPSTRSGDATPILQMPAKWFSDRRPGLRSPFVCMAGLAVHNHLMVKLSARETGQRSLMPVALGDQIARRRILERCFKPAR